jgi:hypothetical protein
MNWPLSTDATVLLGIVLVILGSVLILTLVLVIWAILWIRRIELPPGADFMVALRATPLVVVVILDLLDLSLDIFSAPITWFLLGRLGLGPLRGVAVVKDLIPLTNFIPLMTLSWLFARYFTRENGHLIPLDELPYSDRLPRLHR